MSDETTSRLDSILKNIKTKEEAEGFVKEHAEAPKFFYEYLNEYIAEHRIVVSEMIERSGISKNYIYNILNGVTKHPGRDKVIAVCIAAGMDLNELNRGLKISGNNGLYPKNERDIHIASCVNRGMMEVTVINLELEKIGVAILEV